MFSNKMFCGMLGSKIRNVSTGNLILARSKATLTTRIALKHKGSHISKGLLVATGFLTSSLFLYSNSTKQATLCESSNATQKAAFREFFEAFIRDHQQRITKTLGDLDGQAFKTDNWERAQGGGGGSSMVLQDGNVFEKAGVNISVVHGNLPKMAVAQMSKNHAALKPENSKDMDFFAAGLSLVIHPKNPHAPTVHLNYRYFELDDSETGEQVWWFGGGTDLTPSYLYEDDVLSFHQGLKDACDTHKVDYQALKEECDDYFTIPHRKEKRGVGGIFFDDFTSVPTISSLDSEDERKRKIQSFQDSCLSAFLPSYVEIINKRKDQEFTEEEKRWQQLRRGRYVEFNLVYDRGTKFGLYAPNPRYESILMSLPLTCRFEYMHSPAPGSKEAEMLEVLKTPVDWLKKEKK